MTREPGRDGPPGPRGDDIRRYRAAGAHGSIKSSSKRGEGEGHDQVECHQALHGQPDRDRGRCLPRRLGLHRRLGVGHIRDGRPDVTGFQLSSSAPAAFGLAFIGLLGIIGGAIGQFAAWIGAVVNTARLEDKTWFVVLLVLGLLSFGFIAMVVFILVGPDGTATTRQPASQPAGTQLTA